MLTNITDVKSSSALQMSDSGKRLADPSNIQDTDRHVKMSRRGLEMSAGKIDRFVPHIDGKEMYVHNPAQAGAR
jgi:hypothetical protein